MSGEQLQHVFAVVDRVYLPRPVARYIARLVAATHARAAEAPPSVRGYVAHGASPRAAIAIAESARAFALLRGRPTAGFADVKAVAAPVLNHRLILNYKARLDQVDAFAVIRDLLAGIEETGLNLPADMKITEVHHG
jgi:MoxR-like ATPase